MTVGEARALDEAAEMLDERQANPAQATAPEQTGAQPLADVPEAE
ncbi:hypothetical protein [Blastomonas sp. AAP53]|nr:hypothetical protein [Blastomonas sp. AAP53]